MRRTWICFALVAIVQLSCVAVAYAAEADIWLWGFRLGQPYSEVEEQLKAFHETWDTDTGGKRFTSYERVLRLEDHDYFFNLDVHVEDQRVSGIDLNFDCSYSSAERIAIMEHFRTLFEDQGIERESFIHEEYKDGERYFYKGDGFRICFVLCEGLGLGICLWFYDPTVNKAHSGEITSEWLRADPPLTEVTPSQAQEIISKSRTYFKKHYNENTHVLSVYKTRMIEYAKYATFSLLKEVKLDERLAVVKYERTRKAPQGKWAWRFVRASEQQDPTSDVIVGVKVRHMDERPLAVRDLESHMYWRNGEVGSYREPSEYVEWWTYICYLEHPYPTGVTIYFSMYHPGILIDRQHEILDEGFYMFTAESIEQAGVIGSLNL